MAYINQDGKKVIVNAYKDLFKKMGIKARVTAKIRNYSSIQITIKSEDVLERIKHAYMSQLVIENGVMNMDFLKRELGYIAQIENGEDQDVRIYSNYTMEDVDAKDFLHKLYETAKAHEWFDKSEPMTDYFHTAYYFDVAVKI